MSERSEKPCDRCLKIIKHAINRAPSHKIDLQSHTDTLAIMDSGKTCQCCKVLWDLFIDPVLAYAKQKFPSKVYDSSLQVCFKISNTGSRSELYRVLWATVLATVKTTHQGRSFVKYGSIGVSIEDTVEHPDHRHPTFWTLGRTSPHLAVAEDRIGCAKDWLETCEREAHRECQPVEGFLPARLIDLRANKSLRLVYTDHFNKQEGSIRYATLSHCWGAPGVKGPLRTTRETAEAFGQEIPESMLPRTFRDAVRITRSLGIPYLWIDSLCILQDDPEEWQREASRMKDVYSGSVLTISAIQGKDSSSGFLPEDDEKAEAIQVTRGMEVDVETKPSSSFINNNKPVGHFSYKNRDNSSVMVRLEGQNARGQLEGAHLSSRGWACQEQILSRRIIYCLDSEIHWQCKQFYHTQSEQTFGVDESLGRGIDLIKSSHEENWHEWVEDYTNREFTISSDRMPALSGITEHDQTLTHQEVLLGVRRRSLAQDLSWVRIGSEKGPAGETAPSWSWFSCNAPICLDYWQRQGGDTEPEVCTVAVDFHVDWTGPTMTSAIDTAVFRVRGPVMKMAIRIAPESSHCNPPYFLIDEEESDFSQEPLPWRCAGQFDHERHPGDIKTEYTCLRLFSRTDQDGTKHRETFLLLLPDTETTEGRQAETTKPCSFRRVGIAMIRGSDKTFSGAKEINLDLL